MITSLLPHRIDSPLLRAAVAATPDSPEIEIDLSLTIPVRDGTSLGAIMYRPRPMEAPAPAILTMTPYGADSSHSAARRFAMHGYVSLAVDVRGRGNSGGTFNPFLQEASDSHDVVKWIGSQSWCDGRVAMWGGSYAGLAQWLAAGTQAAPLATVIPTAAPSVMVDVPAVNGVFYLASLQWLALTSGKGTQDMLFGDLGFWIGIARNSYLRHLAFASLDDSVGIPSQIFTTWLQHPELDDYWRPATLSADDYAKIDMPILTITGQYDLDQTGALAHYREHMARATPPAIAKHYLVIGPWDHAGTRTPRASVGGLTFGASSVIDIDALHVDWFNWVLRQRDKPNFLQRRVAYYVTGREHWKYADSLEAVTATTVRLHLSATDGRAKDAAPSGALSQSPSANGVDSYVYDPRDTRFGEQFEKSFVPAHITDQRLPLNLFGNGLVYQSEPFAAPLEISGFVTLVAYISVDVPDTDFGVVVYEIQPDGVSMLLTQDLLRARYRNGMATPSLLTPGEIVRYEFRGFRFVSRLLAAGSRVRLVISCPNSVYLEKNYNGGGEVAFESGDDARVALVKLHRGPAHVSCLELPVGA